MSVTVGTPTAFNRTAGAFPWSDSFNAVIDTGATAVLLFITNAASLAFNPAVTVGGVAATVIATAKSAGGQGTIWVYGLLAPTIGASIAISISNGSNFADIGACGVVPLLGTATSGAFEVSAAAASSASTQTLSVTTLTAADLICSAGLVYFNPNAPTKSGTTTVTQLYLCTQTNHQQYGYTMPAATAGSWSETFTTTFNMTGLMLVGVKPPGGGGPTSAVQQLVMIGCGN